MNTEHKIVGTFAVLVLLILAYRAFLWSPNLPPPPPPKACKGEPINVDYAFKGGDKEPHECKVQCEDGGRRYIAYTDGVATQCESPPGCNDWGEDSGITCSIE